MRALVILVIALFSSAAVAESERARRVDDTVYVHAGTHLGIVRGGALSGGPTIGIHGALGARLSPDLAVQLSANHQADHLASGIRSTGVAAGLSWFVLDWTAVTANVRYRALNDGAGIAETLGQGIGGAFCLGGCPEVTTEIRTRDLGVELALTSTVQWTTFTFGVEWIAFHQPLIVLDAERRVHDEQAGRTRVDTPDFGADDLPWEVRFLSLNFGAAF